MMESEISVKSSVGHRWVFIEWESEPSFNHIKKHLVWEVSEVNLWSNNFYIFAAYLP
jgi:hypothetical protein